MLPETNKDTADLENPSQIERISNVRIAPDNKLNDSSKFIPAVLSFIDNRLTIRENEAITFDVHAKEIKRVKVQAGLIYLNSTQGNKIIILDDGKKDDVTLGVDVLQWPKVFRNAGIKTGTSLRPIILASLVMASFISTIIFSPYVGAGFLLLLVVYYFKR